MRGLLVASAAIAAMSLANAKANEASEKARRVFSHFGSAAYIQKRTKLKRRLKYIAGKKR